MAVKLGDVDLFLIIAIVVALSMLLIVAFYLLVNYQHPDDKNDAYFPKAVVIFGFILASMTVLMLPLDVANNEGYAGRYKFT
jgi:LMBR1 domain-containing protein 1